MRYHWSKRALPAIAVIRDRPDDSCCSVIPSFGALSVAVIGMVRSVTQLLNLTGRIPCMVDDVKTRTASRRPGRTDLIHKRSTTLEPMTDLSRVRTAERPSAKQATEKTCLRTTSVLSKPWVVCGGWRFRVLENDGVLAHRGGFPGRSHAIGWRNGSTAPGHNENDIRIRLGTIQRSRWARPPGRRGRCGANYWASTATFFRVSCLSLESPND